MHQLNRTLDTPRPRPAPRPVVPRDVAPDERPAAPVDYDAANARKAQFAHTYNRGDPRAYFAALRPLDYDLPARTAPAFAALAGALREARGLAGLDVLDIGCSYGINSALLKFGLTLPGLYAHYGSPAVAELTAAALQRLDTRRLKRTATAPGLRMIGLDAAEQAVAYGLAVGLLDRGVAANLEAGPADGYAAALLAPTDLVISTGCVGYVTEATFARLLEALDGGPLPWFACSVLRIFAYDRIAATLAEHGLTTEMVVAPSFAQRRFASPEEQAHAVGLIAARGLDPAPELQSGRYHANLFVSRPAAEAGEVPLSAILGCMAVRVAG